jgi:hypothetical protein
MSEPQQSILEEKLEWVERCLRAAEGHLELQNSLIADLEQRGADTGQARALLNILRETHRMHLAEREALIKQIELDGSI